MQQEFYIGQKVRTSQVGIERGCTNMQGSIIAVETSDGHPAFVGWFRVGYTAGLGVDFIGIFSPEEIEPTEDSTPQIVFDNIAKSL